MMGMHFDKCKSFLFAINVRNSILDFSSFYRVDLRKSTFDVCTMKETDFTEANLQYICLADCNLTGATFSNTDLRGTDFSSAFGYAVVPENNKIKGARFSASGISGLLLHLGIDITA
jgi:uncharacterized protein YjbI with pentapeptide repeats